MKLEITPRMTMIGRSGVVVLFSVALLPVLAQGVRAESANSPSSSEPRMKRVDVERTPEEFAPNEDKTTSVLFEGKEVKRVRRSLRFRGPDGKERRRIPLIHTKELGKSHLAPPYDRLLREVSQQETVCPSGNAAGITEFVRVSAPAPESEGPILESSRTFRYYDHDGKLLWRTQGVEGRVSMSSDCERIGAVAVKERTLEEINQDQHANQTVAVVFDKSGNEVFRYDPGPEVILSYVSLSPNGKYGVAGRVCFEVDTGKLHDPAYRGSGLVGINDTGVCRVTRNVKDAQGKYRRQTVYEYRL